MDDSELRALLAAQQAQIAALVAALAPAAATLTLAELYQRYEAAQRHRAGWRAASFMLRPVVTMHGPRATSSLIPADWTSYRLSRGTLAPSSLNFTLRCLKAMLRWGRREGLMPTVPQLCDAAKQPQKAHRETAPTEADVGKLLDEAEEAKDRVIVLCACDSGMRNTEIRLLQWSWVDRVAMLIRLPASITKSRKARPVPMTKRQLAAIDNIPRDIRSPYVLRSQKGGGPFSRDRMTRRWRALAELAELEAAPGEKRVRLHDGRHGYATNAVARGVRIEVVSEILGHASLEQTRAYVQPRPRDLADARETFEAGIERDRARR